MSETIYKEDWYGLYGEKWTGVEPETFSHPAKFARALIRRIYRHLLDEKLIQPGQMILNFE